MAINIPSSDSCNPLSTGCPDSSGCPSGVCPDFTIKRHDTYPPFRVNIADCDGPLDLSGLVLESNMWSLAKLKKDVASTDTYFQLADNIGFNQMLVGDIIIVDRARYPEHMLVTGFDENLKYVQVQRGYNGTPASNWKKGQQIRIFRILNAIASTEMIFNDEIQVDGTTKDNVLQASYLVYEWNAQDTCLPGCYYMEFKLIKMKDVQFFTPGGYWIGDKHLEIDGLYHTGTILSDSSVTLNYNPSTGRYEIPRNQHWTGPFHFWTDDNYYTGTQHDDGSVFLDTNGLVSDPETSYNSFGVVRVFSSSGISEIPSFSEISSTPSDFNCPLGVGVEWIRRFPVGSDGFLIKIIDSPTSD